jgi:hypothetical protein
LVADKSKQPSVYTYKDITDFGCSNTESTITMEMVKFEVVKEFADYLLGKRKKESINSQIEDHVIPVQIMSGIYSSNIMKQIEGSNIVKSPWGQEVKEYMK